MPCSLGKFLKWHSDHHLTTKRRGRHHSSPLHPPSFLHLLHFPPLSVFHLSFMLSSSSPSFPVHPIPGYPFFSLSFYFNSPSSSVLSSLVLPFFLLPASSSSLSFLLICPLPSPHHPLLLETVPPPRLFLVILKSSPPRPVQPPAFLTRG